MSMNMEVKITVLTKALDGLLVQYALLNQENNLLRDQLKRHPAGVMQIRAVERRILEIADYDRRPSWEPEIESCAVQT